MINKSAYKDALRQLRKRSTTNHQSYVSDLFPVGWAYAEEASSEPAAQASTVPVEKAPSVTEKTKIMDSFHEFAKKRLEENDKEAFIFPGGEARKKSVVSAVFETHQGRGLSSSELEKMSSDKDLKFSELKFSLKPKAPIKVLFVADESRDVETLENAELGLEAFFDPPAAQLFDRMIAAMKLGEGERFVTSLKVLKGAKSLSFEEGVAQEIYNLRPQIVISLGGGATSAFLGNGLSLQNSHGQFFEREVLGEKPFRFEVMPLFSPAVLVEAPNTKRIAWEDMQKTMKKLGIS